MIVQSYGSLQSMEGTSPLWGGGNGSSLSLNGHNQAYADIYRTQPNVRICVDFIDRNIAQLGIHVFRRISDTDRERLTDHDMARWLGHPNPATGRYRLIESLVADLGIYFNAYLLKIRTTDPDGRDRIGLVRLPPEEMAVVGGLLPDHFVWTHNGYQKDLPLNDVVHFGGYNPLNPLMGLSPLETLRRILAEESAAGDHRESFWRNSARMEGVIERPPQPPGKTWTPDQRKSFREQWQEFSAGGARAGMTAVLEDGMSYKQASFSAKDSEYTQGGKLRREVVAAAYHIPLPMVGILEHATFSNVKEQHKHLYQDCLGPWLVMIEEEFERQLLTECQDQRDVYIEFNIAEKLRGSFEEQAQSLLMLVGKPIMTANEGRSRLNLPSMDDEEANMLAPQQGGPAQQKALPTGDVPTPDDDAAVAVDVSPVIQATRDRQTARLSKVAAVDRPARFVADLDRWNRELAADLSAVTGADESGLAEWTNAETLARLESDATHARLMALETA